MATAFRLISESESVRYTGVSLDTIRQYERFGLLQSVRKDHETFYRESDLRAVFAVTEQSAAKTSDESASTASESVTNEQDPAAQTSPAPEPVEQEAVEQGPVAQEPVETPETPDQGAPQYTDAPAESATQAESAMPTLSDTRVHQQITYSTSSSQPPGMFEILESNKTLREQIVTLKDERDWLRRRVEKLETRGERDQMILIAENETVKGLIHHIDKPRKSFWSLSLPWLKGQ